MTAKEYWKSRFDEEPQTDAERLACAMMAEYAEAVRREQDDLLEWLRLAVGHLNKLSPNSRGGMLLRKDIIKKLEMTGKG